MIDKLFSIERKTSDFEELRRYRKEESRPLVQEILEYLLEIRPKYLPREGMMKAIDYVIRHWQELILFCDDLSIPLSNNDAERALRHVVMGRKNFLGSKTINGADTAATLYTVIESCKKSSLQPTEYFKYLITERWHKRDPLTPYELAIQKFGLSKTSLPDKEKWKIA